MRILRHTILAALMVLAAAAHGAVPGVEEKDDTRYHAGKLLVASPHMRDPRFHKSVVYMLEHNAGGAQGIIVNKVYGEGPVAKLLRGFGVEPEDASGTIKMHFGGPVSPDTAFILHTSDYKGADSQALDDTFSFSTDIRILRDMGGDKAPRRVLFALGYAGWAPGQLEEEIERGDWTIAEATEDIVFGGGDGVWERLSKSSALPL